MRFFLALMVLGSACFAQYSEPPIAEVMENNTELAPSLDGAYNGSMAVNGTLDLIFGEYSQTQYLNASLDIAGLNLLVDNSTFPAEGLSVLVARGYQMSHLSSMREEGYPQFACSQSWFDQGAQYAYRCDFDDDTCVEYEAGSGALYDLDAIFSFRGLNETVIANSTLIEVPGSIMEAMRDSSGADDLTIRLEGNVTFFYEINNRSAGFDCGDNVSFVNESLPISANRSFRVSGENKLFFLRSPVLREQWARNSDFNLIVLSQSPLYRAELYRDGTLARNLTLRSFYVAPAAYGVLEIWSNLSGAEGFSESGSSISTPIPLERENHSFLYAYELNSSFPPEKGVSGFTMLLTDSFGNNASYSENVTDRMLSYGGAYSEDGGAAGAYTRPSAESARDTLSRVTVAFGLIALVIFLAFFNFWAR